MLGRLAPEDVRERSVQSLLTRYSVDVEQAKRVQSVALGMFDQVSRIWQLQDEEWRDLLGWAALTHEVGLAISHSSFHKHGAYVLTHSDLPGFSRQEQLVLAILVQSHRRKLREAQFESLPPLMRLSALRVALLLRLAAVLNHSRKEFVPPLFLEAEVRTLTVKFPPGWLTDHPLTEAGLLEEVELWPKLGLVLEVK
jgi:exopolyphosphatase/guanosine-5'-triphosphate,3'-diphosphate pyrophosphatase